MPDNSTVKIIVDSIILNSFQTDINALKWCKYTGNLCSLDRPLDDAVLASFANALENNVLCSWRHSPPHSTQRLNQGLTCSESAKELWLFWYGDDPRTNNIVDSSLKGLLLIVQ
jgi:mediator of RNA polymerase II transcription subunit 13